MDYFDNVKWIPKNAIKAIHQELLKEHGGFDGSMNQNAFESTVERPKQLAHYGNPPPTLYELAASYGFGFARNHCFSDGNKRVALAIIDVFLRINGYMLVAEEVEAVFVIETLASGNMTEVELSIWVLDNSSERVR